MNVLRSFSFQLSNLIRQGDPVALRRFASDNMLVINAFFGAAGVLICGQCGQRITTIEFPMEHTDEHVAAGNQHSCFCGKVFVSDPDLRAHIDSKKRSARDHGKFDLNGQAP